jgi:hypothetical protein
MRNKVFHVYQPIGSGIRLEYFESYVPFSRIFARIAGCSEEKPRLKTFEFIIHLEIKQKYFSERKVDTENSLLSLPEYE